jgi:hypothetical protein
MRYRFSACQLSLQRVNRLECMSAACPVIEFHNEGKRAGVSISVRKLPKLEKGGGFVCVKISEAWEVATMTGEQSRLLKIGDRVR